MKLPRHFLSYWLSTFEKSRFHNHKMVTGFVSRIESILPGKVQCSPGESVENKIREVWRTSFEAFIRLLKTLWLIRLEKIYLLREIKRLGDAGIWLVADDRRTGVIHDWISFESQLRIFGASNPPSWLIPMQAVGRQLICFTPNLIALRPSESNGVIHLSYLSLFAVPFAWPGAFLTATVQMFKNQQLLALSRSNAWITSLLAASFDVLLARKAPHELLMITSNSFVIELLRYMVVADGNLGRVTEVLHGIPTLEIETYHMEMINFNSVLMSNRLTLIPPVPELKLDSAEGRINILNEVINLKMNTVCRQRDLSSLAVECINRQNARSCIPVVTLNGGVTVERKRYLNSGCFAIEHAILKFVLWESRRQGISIQLQYSLHPAHIKSGEAVDIRKVVEDDKIYVIEDSFQTWLESELCISIYSSASWDAVALGCDVVFCVCPEDKLYSSSSLGSFSHPTSHQGLFEVLSKAISRLPVRTKVDPIVRVERAIGRNSERFI